MLRYIRIWGCGMFLRHLALAVLSLCLVSVASLATARDIDRITHMDGGGGGGGRSVDDHPENNDPLLGQTTSTQPAASVTPPVVTAAAVLPTADLSSSEDQPINSLRDFIADKGGRLATGQRDVLIEAHGQCRWLDNNSTSGEYFVPFATPHEWQAFLDYAPASIVRAECCPARMVTLQSTDGQVATFNLPIGRDGAAGTRGRQEFSRNFTLGSGTETVSEAYACQNGTWVGLGPITTFVASPETPGPDPDDEVTPNEATVRNCRFSVSETTGAGLSRDIPFAMAEDGTVHFSAGSHACSPRNSYNHPFVLRIVRESDGTVVKESHSAGQGNAHLSGSMNYHSTSRAPGYSVAGACWTDTFSPAESIDLPAGNYRFQMESYYAGSPSKVCRNTGMPGGAVSYCRSEYTISTTGSDDCGPSRHFWKNTASATFAPITEAYVTVAVKVRKGPVFGADYAMHRATFAVGVDGSASADAIVVDSSSSGSWVRVHMGLGTIHVDSNWSVSALMIDHAPQVVNAND